jgi:glycosyltransferase
MVVQPKPPLHAAGTRSRHTQSAGQVGIESLKITVVTVTFNSAKTIVETLDSVARQSHPDIEHIVVDGGSSDETLALVARYGAHVTRVVSEADEGIYDAMNKGLRLASGELVGFLNSDDTFASTDVVACIARIAADEKPDVLFGDLVYVDPARSQPLVRYWRAGAFSMAKLRLGWMPPHPTLYVRRQVIARVGFFDAKLRIAADYDFMLKLLSTKGLKVAYIPQVLVNMRVGGASNQSIAAMVRKSREDLASLRKHRVGGLVALLFKNLRKLPQFLVRPQG